jgi:ABC-type dipeptide/oligopeptide/nickel transport system permease subunit
MVGLVIIIVIPLLVILAPYIAPLDPSVMSKNIFQSPSREHLLGTNAVGQDIFSTLLYAGRISLFVGFVGASIVLFCGATLGLISGYFSGWVDELIMRIADVLLALPPLPLMLVLAAYLGPGIPTIIFVIALIGWASIARQIRSQVLSTKEHSFVEASKALGASDIHIMIKHILPNLTGILVANFIMDVMMVILMEAGLSFLGLGDPLHKSWGVMLYFAQTEGAFSMGAWWWILPPGICIAVLGCGFSFVGTTLNDRFIIKQDTKNER